MKTIFKKISKVALGYEVINEMNINVQFVSSTYVVIYDSLIQHNNTYIVNKVVVDLTNENPIQIVYLKDIYNCL